MAHITENDILFWAVETGNQPVLEALYRSKKVMDIHKARDKYDRTLLMRAAESGQDKIVSFLLDKVQMHVNGVNDKQETALMWGQPIQIIKLFLGYLRIGLMLNKRIIEV